MQQRTEPGAIEWFGRGALFVVVAAALLLLAADLFVGQLRIILPISGSYWDTENEGVELALFPLAAAGAAMARSRLGALATLRASRMGPALPLLAAAALAALLWYLGWTWELEREWHSPERLLGAVLVASAGVAGCALFPRHTAVLAGAIAPLALFGATVVAFPGLLYYPLYDPLEERDARVLMAVAAPVGSLLLLAASVRLRPRAEGERPSPGSPRLLPRLVGAIRLRPPVLRYAAWSAAIALWIGVTGYLWGPRP